MVDRWFDLRKWDASLERFKGENGVYLKLNLSDLSNLDKPDVARAIVAAGWEADTQNPKSFINRSRIGSFSEIQSAIAPFFKDSEIGLEDISKLDVNVYTGAYVRGELASSEQIEANLLFDGHRREIILARVKAAAALAGIAKKQRLPFNGMLTRSMSSKFKRFEDPREAAYLFARVCMAFADGRIEESMKLEQAIESAFDAAGPKGDVTIEQVGSGLTSFECSELLRDYTNEVRYNLDTTFVCAQVAQSIINPTYIDPNATEAEQDAARRKQNSQLATDMFLNLTTGVSTPCTLFENDFLKDADFARQKLASPPIKIAGFPVRYEHSLSSELKWQSHERLRRALQTCTEIFGNDNDPLFGNQQTFFHISHNALGGRNGKHHSRFFETPDYHLKQGQITFSPYVPYALTHEIGHAVDYGHSYLPGRSDDQQKEFDLAKVKRLLEDTGILKAVQKIADPSFYGSVINVFSDSFDFIRYLTNPREIFARAFEEAVVNRVEASGDTELQSLGGGFIRRANFMIKDPDVLEHFIAEVRSFNREFMRENNLAADRQRTADQSLSYSQPSM